MNVPLDPICHQNLITPEKCIALVVNLTLGKMLHFPEGIFFYCGKNLKWQKIPLVNVKFQIYGKVFVIYYLLGLTKSKR